MQPLIAKFLLKIHCLSGNRWRVKHNLTQHDCYPNKARISPPLFSFFFYLLLKFDQMCLLSTSWASSRLPVRNHSETTNKVIKTERRPHHMFKPWLLDSYLPFHAFYVERVSALFTLTSFYLHIIVIWLLAWGTTGCSRCLTISSFRFCSWIRTTHWPKQFIENLNN